MRDALVRCEDCGGICAGKVGDDGTSSVMASSGRKCPACESSRLQHIDVEDLGLTDGEG